MPDAPLCQRCGMRCAFFRDEGSTGIRILAFCEHCNKRDMGKLWYSKKPFTKAELDSLPTFFRDRPARTCPVCVESFMELEYHHLAPREQFGVRCEHWPGIEVCRGCHEEWHRRMGQSINLRAVQR